MLSHLKRKENLLADLIIVGLLSLALASNCASAMQNEPGEFRGIKWGSSVQGITGMRFLAEDGDLKFYERAGDPMQFEEVNIDRIVYGFHKDRFYNVMAYYSSVPNFLTLKDMLSRKYGEPYRPEESANKYFWNGENVDILLIFDDGRNSGRVTYFHKPIQNEIDQPQ